MSTAQIDLAAAIDEVHSAIADLAPDDRFGPIGYQLRTLRELRNEAVRDLRGAGTPITHIARMADLSRQGVYDILREELVCVFSFWVDDGPGSRWVEVARRAFSAEPAQVDGEVAIGLLEDWLHEGLDRGHYQCEILVASGAQLTSVATMH